MNLLGMLELSGSALAAERLRAEMVTGNLANVRTTRTPEGGPFRRRLVLFRAAPAQNLVPRFALAGGKQASGVQVDGVMESSAAPILRYEPGHPDANAGGYVAYPAIEPMEEMADLLGAVRAYELNATAVQAAKGMIQQSLELLK